jgi:hypothetical protein
MFSTHWPNVYVGLKNLLLIQKLILKSIYQQQLECFNIPQN